MKNNKIVYFRCRNRHKKRLNFEKKHNKVANGGNQTLHNKSNNGKVQNNFC